MARAASDALVSKGNRVRAERVATAVGKSGLTRQYSISLCATQVAVGQEGTVERAERQPDDAIHRLTASRRRPDARN